jgi:hypothetical protein
MFPRSWTYLEALLASLDGGDIAGNTATDDNKVLLLCANVSLPAINRSDIKSKPIPVSVA